VAGSQSYCGGLLKALGGQVLGDTNKSMDYPKLTSKEMEKLKPDLILLPTEPYPFNEKDRQEMMKLFPKSKVDIINGELLTWYLSRTPAALRYLKQNYFT
jgi:ABC-type Fe3+-citrate transport system substrate-binding protein